MPKFKFGDRVRCVKQNKWVPVGTCGTVKEDSTVPVVEWDNGYRYCLFEEQMDPESDTKCKVNIVIYRQGNKVIAKLNVFKNTYAIGEALCNPDDQFSWVIGSQIALQRLMKAAFGDAKAVLPKDTQMSDLFMY